MIQLTENGYGNIDCRGGVPAGWRIVWDVAADNDLSTDEQRTRRAAFWTWVEREHIAHHCALVGFQHVDAQYFPRAHYGKPAHYRPVIQILIPAQYTSEPWREA